MLPRADMTGTRPLASVEAPTSANPSTSAKQEVFQRLTQIAIGSQHQAQVLARLDNGTFVVRIADTKARMNLPDGTRVGDSLSMTMLAAKPRPTFLLGAESGGATATLSSAGRLIDSLLQNAQQQGASNALAGKTALLASPALLAPGQDMPQVAAALYNTLSSSGLFYESHLQQWVNGGRTAAELAQEPQAQHGKGSSSTTLQPDTIRGELAQLLNHMREWVAGDRSLTDLLRQAQMYSGHPAITDADTIAGGFKPAAMDFELMQLVTLQLNALEQRQVLWRGELFPGQPLEWEINEDTSGGGGSGGDPENGESSWQSTVRFELPALGTVAATIHLIGDRVHVQVSTASEPTAAKLREHGSQLADAMGAAGSPLESLSIKQDEKA